MSFLKTFLPYLFGNKKGKSYELPRSLDFGSLNFEERLMFSALQHSLESFVKSLSLKDLKQQEIYHLFSFGEYLPEAFFLELKSLYPSEYELFSKAISAEILDAPALQELLNFKNHKLTLFALMNPDRTIPGRIFIRRADGTFVHTDFGRVWSLRVLGNSGRGLAFNHSNGRTPAGVFTVDSVMPEANKNYEFGKFRRLIVNFINASSSEELLKKNLPKSHHDRSWWLPSVLGRELGRSLLRIHGTGRINKNPFTSFYPMVPSSGCLTVTERSFMGIVKFNDQRVLLDTLMKAQGLEVTYENESKIHGLLYVIEFSGKYQALEFKS